MMMTQYLVRRLSTQIIEYGIRASNVTADFVGPVDPDNPGPTALPPCEPGCELIEWDGDWSLYSTPPSRTCTLEWDGAGPAWVDRGSLDEHRANKNSEINVAWIRADSAAFEYSGEQFRAGADDVLRLNSINGYISLMNEMPPDWIGVWKTMADTFIELPDVDSWKRFYTAFVMKGVTNYLAAQVLKARLAAATTADEIAAITWPE